MRYPVSDPGAQLYNGKFTDGIPASGVPTSVDKAAHMNAVYDELIAVITGAGLTPSETTLNQVLQAINGLIAAAIATRAPTLHGHLWNQISGIPASFPPSAHNQDWGTITGRPSAYPPSEHSQDWSTITGRPATFPPVAHDHNYVPNAGNADTVGGVPASQLFLNSQISVSGNSTAWEIVIGVVRIKGGIATSNLDPDETFIFAEAFPNICLGVLTTPSSINAAYVYSVTSITAGSFTVNRTDAIDGSAPFRYVAFGN